MDNHHVNICGSSASCGVLELSDFKSDARKILYAVATHLYHPSRGQPAAFVLWSDLYDPKHGSNGQRLAGMLDTEKLLAGGLHTTAPHENPKTSNPIQVWLWSIPHELFRQWYKDERIRRAKNI